MTNEEIVCELQAQRDHGEMMLQLLRQNRGFITKMAKPYLRTGCVSEDDLDSIAFLSASYAVDAWDATKGVPFLSMWALSLRSELQRSYNESRSMPVPDHINSECVAYVRLKDRFMSELSRSPTQAEVAQHLGLSERKAGLIMQTAYRDAVSLDAPIDTEDSSQTLGDTVQDPSDLIAETESEMDRQRLRECLTESLERLSEDEKTAVVEKYLSGTKTVPEVAESMNVTVADVRRFLRTGLKKMSRQQALIRFCESVNVFHGTGLRHFVQTRNSQPEIFALQRIHEENKEI